MQEILFYNAYKTNMFLYIQQVCKHTQATATFFWSFTINKKILINYLFKK